MIDIDSRNSGTLEKDWYRDRLVKGEIVDCCAPSASVTVSVDVKGKSLAIAEGEGF